MVAMKARLQTSLGQHLVLTPQLRQAIHLLQLSALELEAELAEAVETNPLLDWAESAPLASDGEPEPREDVRAQDDHGDGDDGAEPWQDAEPWQERGGSFDGDDESDAAERAVETDNLHDHLLWQLHLSPLSRRDRQIGVALVDAIDDDGYLRESFEAIRAALQADLGNVDDAELLAVLTQIQRFDPAGVGARDLAESLQLQLAALPADTSGVALAARIAQVGIERLPKLGVDALARELRADAESVERALQLLRSLDPRPGAQMGALPTDTYITPDCMVWRQHGVWQASLASGRLPRLTIHRGYEQMIGRTDGADATYLRGRLQEARWLLKNLEARGETLLKVMRCLMRQQAGFLEFGPQALRPLTLREVAAELQLHESTISRAIARKYVRTPRGTLPLRAFFASGIDTGDGGEASSTAIQDMIRRLIDAENPRKPLSDARLADLLKGNGVPVARRTVAKYREAMRIPSSHERTRLA